MRAGHLANFEPFDAHLRFYGEALPSIPRLLQFFNILLLRSRTARWDPNLIETDDLMPPLRRAPLTKAKRIELVDQHVIRQRMKSILKRSRSLTRQRGVVISYIQKTWKGVLDT